jgi:hypothetical protein
MKTLKRMSREKRNRYTRNVNSSRRSIVKTDKIETYREIWNNGVRKLDSQGRPVLAHVGYKTMITSRTIGWTFYKTKHEIQKLMQKKRGNSQKH